MRSAMFLPIGALLFAVSLCMTPRASAAGAQLQLQGHRTVHKGWGNDLGSYLEELWSYVLHGHGRRTTQAVWARVTDGSETGGQASGTGQNGQNGDCPPPPHDYLKFNGDAFVPPDPGPEPGNAPAPEPGTLAGLLAGLFAVSALRKNRRKTDRPS